MRCYNVARCLDIVDTVDESIVTDEFSLVPEIEDTEFNDAESKEESDWFFALVGETEEDIEMDPELGGGETAECAGPERRIRNAIRKLHLNAGHASAHHIFRFGKKGEGSDKAIEEAHVILCASWTLSMILTGLRLKPLIRKCSLRRRPCLAPNCEWSCAGASTMWVRRVTWTMSRTPTTCRISVSVPSKVASGVFGLLCAFLYGFGSPRPQRQQTPTGCSCYETQSSIVSVRSSLSGWDYISPADAVCTTTSLRAGAGGDSTGSRDMSKVSASPRTIPTASSSAHTEGGARHWQHRDCQTELLRSPHATAPQGNGSYLLSLSMLHRRQIEEALCQRVRDLWPHL